MTRSEHIRRAEMYLHHAAERHQEVHDSAKVVFEQVSVRHMHIERLLKIAEIHTRLAELKN